MTVPDSARPRGALGPVHILVKTVPVGHGWGERDTAGACWISICWEFTLCCGHSCSSKEDLNSKVKLWLFSPPNSLHAQPIFLHSGSTEVISEYPIPRWVWKAILNPQVSKSPISDWRIHPGKLHLQLSRSSYPAIFILLNQEVAAIFPTKTFYVFYMNIIFNCNNEPFYF